MKGSCKESDHLAAIAEGADQLNEDDLVVQELPEGQLANCNPGNLDKIQKNSSFFRESVPYLGCSRELSLNKSIKISDLWESLH